MNAKVTYKYNAYGNAKNGARAKGRTFHENNEKTTKSKSSEDFSQRMRRTIPQLPENIVQRKLYRSYLKVILYIDNGIIY